MSYFHPHYFENLKNQILKISGFTNPIPANCKTISVLIENKTKLKISETTLKRVFGFAFSRFQPSLFTLNAMARYCDYRGWNDFCENQEELSIKTTSPEASKNTLSQNADKITQFTLQALKNKSGIPYYQTIKRNFIDDHFDLFLNGEYDATIVASPAGYGKTIALCHWVEEKLASKTTKNNDDIILFFSMNALMNVFFAGRDINEWLLTLLGYSPEQDITALFDQKKHKGNFFLIIDGLDDYMFKNDQFQLMLNQIIDIFSLYKGNSWFKLVLTMRTATLMSYGHLLDYDQPNWFKGFVVDDTAITNVPPFNISEIKRLCLKINPNGTHQVDADVVKKINYPLYFQFYYKIHKNDFSLKKIDQFHLYELISTFILNKIYLEPNSVEKKLLINELCLKMDFKNQTYAINKIDVENQIRQHKQAYQELVGIGYLREINSSSNLNYKTLIHFGNNDFLAYTIAKKLIDDNNHLLNDDLIAQINNLFKNSPIKLLVLKWCMIYAIKGKQPLSFELLHKADLNSNEKLDILTFMGDVFKKEFSTSRNSEYVAQLFKPEDNTSLLNYFLGLEFISPEYKKLLLTLLGYGLTNKEKILVHSSLATISIIELDVLQLEEQLLTLRKFYPEDYREFAINPLTCLETIYYYLKYGIIKQDAFAAITKFYFNPFYRKNIDNKNNDLLYILAAYTLNIFKNSQKTNKLINAVNRINDNKNNFSEGYHFLFKIAKAETALSLNKTNEGLALYNELAQLYNTHKPNYTPFMRALFYMLKIRANIAIVSEHNIFDDIQTLLDLSEQFGYKLLKLNCLVFILENQVALKIDTDYYKLIYYDFIKVIRESGFKAEDFISNHSILI